MSNSIIFISLPTYLPSWLKLPADENNKLSLKLNNGSQIKAVSAAGDAGRSEAVSLLIVDEAAFIENIGEIWASAQQTLATGGGAIVLSTPYGTGNWFHQTWVKAESDAMKRALMTFGNPFGLALYDKEQRGVAKEMSMEDARKLMMKQVATTWKNMGGSAAQFKELGSNLAVANIDVYEFVHSSILDQELETIEAIQEFANEVTTKGKTR